MHTTTLLRAVATPPASPFPAMPWHGVIPREEEELYRRSGFGAGRVAKALRRPALLIIDMQYRSSGETRRPITESMEEYATSCRWSTPMWRRSAGTMAAASPTRCPA